MQGVRLFVGPELMLKYYQVIVVIYFSCSAYVFLCFPPFLLAFAFPSLQIFTSSKIQPLNLTSYSVTPYHHPCGVYDVPDITSHAR